ncbi:uncharacterized protein NP_7032A (plasmid) [Natronomonas pharaonis DSM 2160]|uniref:Uncharacterized protein n=1 Tax=Natronomonas pharaonis (strain ATCC 35678 / DSM 2160 / CIP 103997 / JCM 8858 / NBRC 14720 / NCIMB 2260 / Gabara) TaxID=348780 RepID=Q3ILT8_NATPD|nr:uncharacterized protein NP_3308A [Natronomonas pharaonis DSM 2160]CAI50932.1 uncharacterized protein NP_7032A [Natronomonas pharaonis DSM 2160]
MTDEELQRLRDEAVQEQRGRNAERPLAATRTEIKTHD